jgi:CheY-like chemotaxis protein
MARSEPPLVNRYTLVIGPVDERAATEGILLRAGIALAAATVDELSSNPNIVRPEVLVCDDATDREARAETIRRLLGFPALQGVPYVVLAWDSDIDSFSEAITRGAAAYFVKPVSPRELVVAVRRIADWMDSSGRTERRRRLRRPLLLKVTVEIKPRRVCLPGQLLDVSGGGCRLDLPGAVAPGETVRVILHGSEDTTHVALGAEVRWHRAMPSGRHEAGLRFTGMTALLAGKLLGVASTGST